ncbi:hypothetical protein [Streptomyces cinereospinus]|uniref:Secreted protein n=1 Tax=Streptomyces cinereospinus TaxID=285561 RepID=A0ABV5MVN0_9ACTN
MPTATGLLALAAPADAHAAAATRAGREVGTLPFTTGAVHVHRRGGHVCAVTLPGRPGPRYAMSVSGQARGNRPVADRGGYTHRAGPVTVHAGQRCVWVKGSVGRGSVSSGRILC